MLGRVLVAVLMAAFAGGLATARQAASSDERPNIILVMADDLGWGELGCYGQERIRTPEIDRLAAEGVRFTRFYSASTVCAPARCAIMTGFHTGHGQIRGNREVGGWGPEEPEGQWPLAAGQVTLAEVLRGAGYATACIGKWGLGGPGSEGHPNLQGFDHFYGYLCQRVAHNLYPTHLWRNHDVDVLHGNRYFTAHQRIAEPPEDWGVFRGQDFAPAEMLAEAERWIGQRGPEPWFLYFPTIIPHAALQAPEDWVDRSPREWDEAPLGGAYLGQQGYLPCERPRATYAAMISFLDHSVGRLRAAAEAREDGRETVIIFTSDNGTTFNGGVDRAFFDSLGGLRGFKTNLYEGGIRVPLVVWWPGRIAGGQERDEVLALYDLMATACEVGGGAAPEGIDGRSFAGLLAGEDAGGRDGVVYIEYPEGAGQQCVVMGRWKAIRPNLRQGLSIELYNLEADPAESRDVAAEHPEIVARAEAIMRAEHTASELFPLRGVDAPPGQ